MDEVLSLKPSIAIKRLQAAVRESQGTSRASYATKSRPEWWRENANVTLPDGTVIKTGPFVSHSKCAWRPEQVQAALVLFHRHLVGENPCEPELSSVSNGDNRQRTKAKAEQVNIASRSIRTRHKTEQTHLDNEMVPDVPPQKHASEPLRTRALRPSEKRKGVTFQEEHEQNIHHTPPRNFRRRKRGPIQITPESSQNPSPGPEASSSRLDAKKEVREAKRESEIEQPQSNPSSSSVGRAAPRRVVEKTSVKELPRVIATRSNSSRHTMPRSVKGTSTSDEVYHESRFVLRKKGKKRRHRDVESAAKRSPTIVVNASDELLSADSATEKENKSPNGTRRITRRQSSRLSSTEDLTPKQKFGVKRSLDETLSEIRTPLGTLKSRENETVLKVVKRRKTTGKSSRKNNGNEDVTLGDTVSRTENVRAENDTGTDGSGHDAQRVLNGRCSPRLQSSRRASESGEVMYQAGLGDVSSGGANENDEEPRENDAAAEDGDNGNCTSNEDDNELDEEEDDEALTEEEKKEENDAIMAAIAKLEQAREECSAKLEARMQSRREDLQNEIEHKVEKLNHAYKMRLMRMSEKELSTLVGQMVYELEGDPSNLLVKEVESVADRILREGSDGQGREGGSSSTQMRLEALKTPKARSLSRAVVAATTERKRVNRERCVATRASVRRSTRKAAQTATARTRQMLTSAVRAKGGASNTEDEQTVESAIGDAETLNMSAPVMAAVANEIARLRGTVNSREGLRALKAQLDSAFAEIV